MSNLNRRQFLGQGAALGALLVTGPALLVACSDDKPREASPTKLGEVKVQLGPVKNTQFAGSYLAQANGYYARVGFEKVELLWGAPGVATEPVVADGTALIGYSSTQSLAAAITAGAKVKVIAAMFQRNPYSVLSIEGKAITTPAGLTGKRVGVQSANEVMWNALLAINKVDPSTIKTLPVQYDPTPLMRGDVDGWFSHALTEPIIVKQKGGKPFVLSLHGVGVTLFDQLIITSEDSLANRRGEVKALLQAELMGWQMNRTDPAAGAKLTVDNHGAELGLDVAHETEVNTVQVALQRSEATDKKGTGYMSAEDLEKNLSVLGQIKLPLLTKATYTNELLDEIYNDGLDLLR